MEKSGHWDKYRENMFITEIDEQHANDKRTNALKPMNCPCHVQNIITILDPIGTLPLRLAEFWLMSSIRTIRHNAWFNES